MSNISSNPSYDKYYYLLGLVFGALTALYCSGSLLSAVIGAVAGLVFAVVFLKALVRGRGDEKALS